VKLTDQWLEIFRAGDYGSRGKYTERDLQAIAASYDPSLHEAPVTIGHPEMNAPALGWVEKLRASGGTLLAKLRQVQPAFEDLVRRGSFKKRSVAFYRPDGGSQLRLRHLAFLGAQPPEVKGLADPEFAQFSESAPAVSIDFEERAPAHGLQVDPASVLFAEKVQRRATEKNISFGQAMRELGQEESSMKFNSCGGSIALDVRSVALAEAAKARAGERNVTFSQALREITAEDATAEAHRNPNVEAGSILFAEAAQRRADEKHIDYGTALREIYAEAAPFTRADGAMRQILVAAIQDGQVILNAGTAAGLKVGDRLSVQRLDREITDPASSNQVIRKTYLPLGSITITKLDDVSADAKGANVGQLKVGDVATVLTAG
jgi:hypothetical protein